VTKLGTLAALASTGVLAAAAFVRPPVSPVPKAAAAQPAHVTVVNTVTTNAVANPPGFTVPSASNARSFMVEEIAFAAYGSAVGELGRIQPKEANPEGPMSLAIDDVGRVHVLDQVNQRISIFDPITGAPARVVPIGSDTVQDLAIDPRGGYAILDRLVARDIKLIDDKGALKSSIGVQGQDVPDAGVITSLFAAKDGFWVEVDHQKLVRIADSNGNPDAVRPTLEGRRFKSSPLLRAARDPAGFAIVSAMGTAGFFARVPFTAPVMELTGLESDGMTTFVGAHIGRETTQAPFTVYDEKVVVVALDGAGSELGRFELPPPIGPEEQLKTMVISPKGEIHHLHMGLSGVSIRRAR
jgi:hypothetical protein